MKKARSYRSAVMASVHEAAAGLHKVGGINKRTMSEFDELCLTPVRAYTAAEIRALRRRERASQSVFAAHLNVTKGIISQWERGERHPRGPSLKLLSLVDKKGLSAIA
jgi:putative transcriptional regulator